MKTRRALLLAIALTIASGAATASSAMADQTVFEMVTPVPLDEVVSVLSSADLRVAEFRHSGLSEGGYALGNDTLSEAVAAYREEYAELHDGAQPQISGLTLEGSVAAEALGPLATNIKAAHGVATTTEQPSSQTSTQDAPEAAPADEPTVGITAAGKLWSPTFGTSSSANVSGSRPRRVRQTMTWTSRASLDDFRRRFLPDDAYEHDYKLFNNSNPGFPQKHPFCFGSNANFWANRSGLTWDTNFPSAAKPYFDTDDSDSCRTQDFTIGLYHPTNLSPNVRYLTTIRTRAGNKSSSPYALTAQKLLKICDFSPFCVGTIPRTGDSQPLVGVSRGTAPGCRLWRKGEDSRPC